MTDENEVNVEHDGPMSLVTINRPKALNALNQDVVSQLLAALRTLPSTTRAVILTGSGEKAFVAGADIKSMSDMSAEEARSFSLQLHRLGDTIEELAVPVIAAINGFALGGGCELMLACDFAIASDAAKFGQPEVGLGVIPGFGGTTRLSRRIGQARARQLVLTGAPIGAQEAFRIGLVNEVVLRVDVMMRAREVAEQVARNAPLAVAYAKQALRYSEDVDVRTANAFEAHTFSLCFATEDQKEGMRAFVEKRAPHWKGA